MFILWEGKCKMLHDNITGLRTFHPNTFSWKQNPRKKLFWKHLSNRTFSRITIFPDNIFLECKIFLKWDLKSFFLHSTVSTSYFLFFSFNLKLIRSLRIKLALYSLYFVLKLSHIVSLLRRSDSQIMNKYVRGLVPLQNQYCSQF